MAKRLLRRFFVAVSVVACVLLVISVATSQRKRRTKVPAVDELLAAGTVETAPKDEILFNEYDFLRARHSPGWRLAVATDATDAYYDPARTNKSTRSAKGWIKYVDKSGGVEQSHTLAYQEFDCVADRSRTLDDIAYSKDDKTLSKTQSPGIWRRIVPESIGEDLYKVFCKGEMDEQEKIMRKADECFRYGRQEEKKGQFELAHLWYVDALTFAPRNAKILAAMKRVGNK